jgi:hypothetical protein
MEELAASVKLLLEITDRQEQRISVISDRLDALTQSGEILMEMHRDNERRVAQLMETITRLGHIIEAHDTSIDEHDERLDEAGE